MTRSLKNRLQKVPIIAKFLNDERFSNLVGLFMSGLINLGFIVVKLFEGVSQQIVWPITLAIYYAILLGLKAILMRRLRARKNAKSDRKTAKKAGWILLAMNFFLTAMIAQMITEDVATRYGLMMIIINAMYTFYCVIMAIVNIARSRKFGNPIITAVKCINFMAALVAVLMLQTSMIMSLDGGTDFMQKMNGITGLFVVLLVFVIALRLVVGSKVDKTTSLTSVNE